MFATKSCFSSYSVLFKCKKINDAAATSSIMLTTNWWFLFFDKIVPNSHKKLEMILIEKLLKWIIPNYVYKSIHGEYPYSCKASPETQSPTRIKGISSMGLCDPWTNSFIHNWKIIKTYTTRKNTTFLLKIFLSLTE